MDVETSPRVAVTLKLKSTLWQRDDAFDTAVRYFQPMDNGCSESGREGPATRQVQGVALEIYFEGIVIRIGNGRAHQQPAIGFKQIDRRLPSGSLADALKSEELPVQSLGPVQCIAGLQPH